MAVAVLLAVAAPPRWRPNPRRKPEREAPGRCARVMGQDGGQFATLADKILRFFADWAAKKWPLRGSLKGPAGDL
jgi:hypothetical protein